MNSLPSSLDETYGRLLNEIDGTLTQAAVRALNWLPFSARILYIEELVDACAIDLERGTTQVLGPKMAPYQLFEILHDMVSIQPPLPLQTRFRHTTRVHRITLCHASVVELLQERSVTDHCRNPRLDCFIIEKRSSDLLMAQTCLAYLFQHNNIFDFVAEIFAIDTPLPPLVSAQCNPQNSPESLNVSIQYLFLRAELYRNRYIYSRASSSFEPNFEARWRTLLADQWPMGQRLGDGLFLGQKLPTTSEEERILWNEVEIDHYDLPFLKGRALIVTQRGYLGWAPDTTRRGDQVFMLAGAQVPFVLRVNCNARFELIGECYIHGFMDGETLHNRESLKMEEVILV